MILPSKHLPQDRALLTVGARLLSHLSEPRTISSLWEEVVTSVGVKRAALRYDAFVLTLDMLFLLGAINLEDGLLSRTKR